MADYQAVLIYDGECPFCSAAASALRRLDGVGAIAWGDEPAQRFLDAQFGEAPFALVLADREEERAYVGRDAARGLCERAGLPVLTGDVIGDNYESIADAVRTATGAAGEPDTYHGEFEMTGDARAAFADLATNAWHTAKVSEVSGRE